jgi:hypothetical protein
LKIDKLQLHPRQLELPDAPAPAPQDLAPLFTIKPDHPNVKWMLELVKKNGWMTRKEIIRAAGRPVNDDNIRWIRALANACGGKILKGQRGFKPLEDGTAAEISAVMNQTKSQIGESQRYLLQLMHEYHRRLG